MTHEIPRVPLSDGTSMPVVGFGTWQLTGEQAYAATRAALDAGYRHLDTATMYRNEAEIGRAVKDSGIAREDLFITTKLPPERAGRELQTIEASLAALDTSYVDLWLVHWPPSRSSLVEVWRAFLRVRETGLVRSVGVSNYSTTQIDELTAATGECPVVNQIPWSPVQHDPKVLAEAAERSVVIEGYSPLKNTDLRNPVLAEIAASYGVTVAQVVLRWHLEHDIVVIPKSSDPARIEANLDLYSFTLTPDEVHRIDNLAG